MMKALVVGTGSIGLRHLRLLREKPELTVEVCDTRPEGLAEAVLVAPDARAWKDYAQALASSPDLVFIATPPASHPDLAESALEAGANVFCEKPMAGDLEGARRMVAAQERTGRMLNVGFVQRFMPELRAAHRMIQEGAIGTVCYARFSIGSYLTLQLSRSRHQRDLYAAAVLDYVYGFDTFWWMFHELPTQVYGRGVQVGSMPLTSNPNLISAILEYGSQRLAEIHIDYVSYPQQGSYRFQGDQGFLNLDLTTNQLEHGDRESGRLLVERFSYERDEIMRQQRDHFLEAVAAGEGLNTPAADALPSSLCVDALTRSLETGRPLPVDPL